MDVDHNVVLPLDANQEITRYIRSLPPKLDLHLVLHYLAIVNGHAGAGRALDNAAILKRKS